MFDGDGFSWVILMGSILDSGCEKLDFVVNVVFNTKMVRIFWLIGAQRALL